MEMFCILHACINTHINILLVILCNSFARCYHWGDTEYKGYIDFSMLFFTSTCKSIIISKWKKELQEKEVQPWLYILFHSIARVIDASGDFLLTQNVPGSCLVLWGFASFQVTMREENQCWLGNWDVEFYVLTSKAVVLSPWSETSSLDFDVRYFLGAINI